MGSTNNSLALKSQCVSYNPSITGSSLTLLRYNLFFFFLVQKQEIKGKIKLISGIYKHDILHLNYVCVGFFNVNDTCLF